MGAPPVAIYRDIRPINAESARQRPGGISAAPVDRDVPANLVRYVPRDVPEPVMACFPIWEYIIQYQTKISIGTTEMTAYAAKLNGVGAGMVQHCDGRSTKLLLLPLCW